MTNIAIPVTPSNVVYTIAANVAKFQSEFTSAVQTVSFSGDHWVFDLSWDNRGDSERRSLQAWLWRLLTLEDRALLTPFGHANRGAYGGTPLVNGGSQTGTSINIDGCSNSITGWALAGDFVQIRNQLVMVTADVNTNGAGQATLSVRPSIRTAPSDNSAVDHASPEGVFLLDSPAASWDARPSSGGGLSSFTAKFMEDVLA